MNKYIAVLLGCVSLAMNVNASIQVSFGATDGVNNQAGGDLIAGALIQVLWSPTDPSASLGVDLGNITGDYGSSRVIHNGFTPSPFQIAGSTAIIPEAFLSVTEPTLLGGYVYVRLFNVAAPTLNDYFAISTITGPGLGDMDPASGSPVTTAIEMEQPANAGDDVRFGGVGAQFSGTALSGIAGDQWHQIVPEPSVLAFLGIGAALVGIRRMRRS